jgi:transcriptional regulator with GAF, ATPase, and Fis domain
MLLKTEQDRSPHDDFVQDQPRERWQYRGVEGSHGLSREREEEREMKNAMVAQMDLHRGGVRRMSEFVHMNGMEGGDDGFEGLLGSSASMGKIKEMIRVVAPTDSTVLIEGETGTGKELVARAIHRHSLRKGRNFVCVNCAAIPPGLIASELFGHEKGAFTGALQRRLGRFELAEGGTIFLDELGELSADAQVSLLRVLQEREFERLGGTATIRTDVRVVAATHRHLPTAVATGRFREDLFYRLSVFVIRMPALRDRAGDIRALSEYFLNRFALQMGKNIKGIDRSSVELLKSYSWPGNIRELQNVIERAVVMEEGSTLHVEASWLPSK